MREISPFDGIKKGNPPFDKIEISTINKNMSKQYHCGACGRPSNKRTCSDAFCVANCYEEPPESYYLTLGFKRECVAGNGVVAEMWVSPFGEASYEPPFLTSDQESSFKLAGIEKLVLKIMDESYEGCGDACLKCGSINELACEVLKIIKAGA